MSEAKKLQLVGTFIPKEVGADKIIFPDGLNTTYEIGKVKLENGMGTLVKPGGTLEDFFNAFVDEKNPTTTQPSVTLTFPEAKAYEVGTYVSPTYTASLNPGKYTYGPATGVVPTFWMVKNTAGEEFVMMHQGAGSVNSPMVADGSFKQFQVTDDIEYKITATAQHTEGTTPKTNIGNEYSSGKIVAGSKSATSGAVTGYRNTFYGTTTDKNDITSDTIRDLTGKSNKALAAGNSFTVTIPVGAMRVVIAYPATLRDITSVKDVNGMNAEIASSFTKQLINVEGDNSYTAISYKVYTLDFANANDVANRFTVTI